MRKYTRLLVSSFFLLLGVVLASFVLAPSIASAQNDQIEAHKEAVRRVIDEGFNQGNFDALDEVFAPDYVGYPPGGGQPESLADFKALIQAYRTAMPDLQATADPVIAEGDWVAFRFSMTGTFQHEMAMGDQTIPPTGQQLTLTANILARLNTEGQVVEEWDEYDYLSIFSQMGRSPSDLLGAPPQGS
jgi:predicted ester cyclase